MLAPVCLSCHRPIAYMKVAKQFKLKVIGSTEEIREQFFAIATETNAIQPRHLLPLTYAAEPGLAKT